MMKAKMLNKVKTFIKQYFCKHRDRYGRVLLSEDKLEKIKEDGILDIYNGYCKKCRKVFKEISRINYIRYVEQIYPKVTDEDINEKTTYYITYYIDPETAEIFYHTQKE
jgi:hypothetical protein